MAERLFQVLTDLYSDVIGPVAGLAAGPDLPSSSVRELETFLRERGRYPRYKTATDPLEKILAVWLERQRHCLRTGKLGEEREAS